MSKVLVTGASGFLGSHLFKELQEYGCKVVGTCRGHQSPALHILDTTDKQACIDFTAKTRPDFVIHCAAVTGNEACMKDPTTAYDVNIIGTANMADACFRTGAKFVFISTASVYDGKQGYPYIESDRITDSCNLYGYTKATAEKVALQNNGAVALRLMKLLGRDPEGHGFVEQAIAGNREYYDNTALQYTLIEDVVRAVAQIMNHPDKFHGIYHLCSTENERYTPYGLAQEIRHGLGIGDDINPITRSNDKTEGPNIVLCVGKAIRKGVHISPMDEIVARLHLEGNMYRSPEGIPAGRERRG